jgi:lysozyme family protein
MRYEVRDSTPEEFAEWRETDYWNKMDFDPLVMFVVIPTVVQVLVFGMMLAVMGLNQIIF